MTGKTNAAIGGSKVVKHGVISVGNLADVILDTGIKDLVQLSIGNSSTANHLLTMMVNGQLQVVVNRGFPKVEYRGNGVVVLRANTGITTNDWVAS